SRQAAITFNVKPETTFDHDKAENFHPKKHCCLVVEDHVAMAGQSGFQNLQQACCPDLEKTGHKRRNPNPGGAPLSRLANMIPIYAHPMP
ncbi:MAG: hypothetical protein OXC72_00825, partial [Roseovarius sp.]|nr:hypothetical protein [Roseovarius sp.]